VRKTNLYRLRNPGRTAKLPSSPIKPTADNDDVGVECSVPSLGSRATGMQGPAF